MIQNQENLFDSSILGNEKDALDFVVNLLQSSTEYSIIGKNLDGTIVLWNEGAKRLYGYSADEVIGKANSSLLHIEGDVASGYYKEIMALALKNGKWEGIQKRKRKNGQTFEARVVITPRVDRTGNPSGFLLISKDISEERLASKSLQETGLWTESFAEAFILTDILGIITDVNELMSQMTGIPRQDLIGHPFKEFFTNPHLAEEGIRNTLQQGKIYNYELEIITRVNGSITVSVNAATFQDFKGRLQGIFISVHNITEQKTIEHHLRNSQIYNRSLFEGSFDGMIVLDLSGIITDVNPQLCRMSGFPEEEMIGSEFSNYFVDVKHAKRFVEDVLKNGFCVDYVLCLLDQKRQRSLISFNASVYRDNSGTFHGIIASAHDVTEKIKLEHQLDAERIYNRGLIEASVDGLVTIDPSMTITDVNMAFCRLSGYPKNELIGTSFPHYFKNHKQAMEGAQFAFDRGQVTDYELVLCNKKGEELYISFNAAGFKDQSNDTSKIFASLRDITSQTQLKHQINQERSYNRGLIEASMDGLITVNQEMVITDVNEMMCKMIGRLRQQIIGTLFSSYFAEKDAAEKGIHFTFENGFISNYILTLQKAGGQQIPISFNAAIFKENDIVKGIFASARDFSEQMQLEEQLKSAQLYTRSLIESNIDALVTTDSLGIITDVNKQMETLTGTVRSELIGSPFKNYFISPELAEQGIKRVLESGQVANYELITKEKKGQTTTVSFNATTYRDQEGNIKGVFASARDITQLKEREHLLSQKEIYSRGLIESSVDGLITIDLDGIITDLNEQMCLMSEYKKSEMLGTPFRDYFTKPAEATAVISKTFHENAIRDYNLTLCARSQKFIQVSFNAAVYRDPSGDIKGILSTVRDITDRVNLENKLKEQQIYLRGLIEASIDGLVTVDIEGYIMDVNMQMCKMSGYERNELIGSAFNKHFTDSVHVGDILKQTLEKGFVKNNELILISKNGCKSTVSFNSATFLSGKGVLAGIFGSARDISEQALLQKQVLEQQFYNRSLIEASPDALFAIAPDGTITDVNQEALSLTGYSRKYLISSPFANYFTQPSRAEEGVKQAFDKNRVVNYELELIKRQGGKVIVSFNAGVFTDINQLPIGILAVARNISEQKELEKKLQDSHFYTRSLIEANIDALITTDPLGIITDVNEQMVKLTEMAREELIGTPLKDYFTDPKSAEESIKQVLCKGKVINYEITVQSKTAQQVQVTFNAVTFYDQFHKFQGVFAALHNIEELKMYEKSLKEKNLELENANKAKDHFLASMSHELRTPLTSILGFTGLMLMKMPGNLTEKQTEFLNNIQQSGKQLLSLINDLLDIARIQAGKIDLKMEDFNCQSALEKIVQELRPLSKTKNLELNILKPENIIIIRTDSRAFNQIILNLVNNAIKFTEKGQIEISMLEKKYKDKHCIAISVTDTGIGIKDDDQKNLFLPFGQIQTKTPQLGTGLGLYLSQKLARFLGGTIEFESEFGKGSTFTLIIPKV